MCYAFVLKLGWRDLRVTVLFAAEMIVPELFFNTIFPPLLPRSVLTC